MCGIQLNPSRDDIHVIRCIRLVVAMCSKRVDSIPSSQFGLFGNVQQIFAPPPSQERLAKISNLKSNFQSLFLKGLELRFGGYFGYAGFGHPSSKRDFAGGAVTSLKY
jgi:hypothetical protein